MAAGDAVPGRPWPSFGNGLVVRDVTWSEPLRQTSTDELLLLLLLFLPMLSLLLLLRPLRYYHIWFAVDGIRFFFPRPHVLGYLQMTPGKKRSTP